MNTRLSLCIRYWSWCNNKCSFCFEQNSGYHDSMFFRPSVESIKINNKCLNELIMEKPYDSYTFKVLGGELFAIKDDDIINELVNSFIYMDSIQKGVMLKHTPEPMVLASNLLYEDNKAMFRCLDALRGCQPKYHIALMSSFDFYGRFKNDEAVELFYRNFMDIIEKYPDVIKPIASIVMSKQNMQAIYQQKRTKHLEIFDKIYESQKHFDAQFLYNDFHVKEFSYSEDDLTRFIDIVNEKYTGAFDVFRAYDDYHNFNTTRYTIQGGKSFHEEELYENKDNVNCLLCEEYPQCRNSFRSIQWHATKCDSIVLLNKLKGRYT